MHLDALADAPCERDRQLAAEVLAELAEAVEHDAAAADPQLERVVPSRQAEAAEKLARRRRGRRVGDTRELGVGRVDGEADRHRLAMAQPVMRHRLELVRRPVTEVERTGAAELERVAGGRDVARSEEHTSEL